MQGRLEGDVVDLGGEDAGEVQHGIVHPVAACARSVRDGSEAAARVLERVGRHLLLVTPGRDDVGKRTEVGDMAGADRRGGGGGGVRDGGGDGKAAPPATHGGGGGDRVGDVSGSETLH